MKNTMRKLFSLALVVVMLACAIPFSAFAKTELELALDQQNMATAAYTAALTEYNDASAALTSAKTAKSNADTALTNAKTARDLAAAKLSEAQKAADDAKAASDAAYTINNRPGYDHSQSAEYQLYNAALLALSAAQADNTAKQNALDSAQNDANYCAALVGNKQDEFNAKKSAYNNAVIAKKAADEFVALAKQNSSVDINDNIIGGSVIGGLGGSNGSTTIVIGGGNGGTIIGGGSNGGTIIGGGSNSGSNTGSNTGSNNNTSGGIWLGNNNTVVNKDPYPVYLNIYLNGNVSTIAKKVDITKGIAADGYVDLADVKTVVRSYFNAKDSDGIVYDGLYIFDGSFGGQYTTDTGRVDGYGNINEARKLSTVNINVMIKNAVAKGSVAADTSNPKTGDMIFLTVTALVASAGALALVYANKKRFLVK